MRITDGEGVAVVLDALGNFRESLGLLQPDGRMVMYGVSNLMSGDKRKLGHVLKGMASVISNLPRFNAVKLMNANKSKTVGKKTVFGLNMLHLWDDKGSLETVIVPMMPLLARGVFKPVVAESFPFDRAADAHRFVQERRASGKVVLTP